MLDDEEGGVNRINAPDKALCPSKNIPALPESKKVDLAYGASPRGVGR
jgi:hypothetical protein